MIRYAFFKYNCKYIFFKKSKKEFFQKNKGKIPFFLYKKAKIRYNKK